jgi:hypothetical protein
LGLSVDVEATKPCAAKAASWGNGGEADPGDGDPMARRRRGLEQGKEGRSGYSKGYSKALEYEYRVKTAALGTLKRYSILSLTLYLEWYNAYSIVGSGGPH